jgi:hypothetical protein
MKLKKINKIIFTEIKIGQRIEHRITKRSWPGSEELSKTTAKIELIAKKGTKPIRRITYARMN